ncbi:methylmalonyl-CoA carboxyltransferase [Sulfolobus sp. A20]|uniref:acyl-CoA carboxylase subunit beta n=1 Tax=Sulfolobaceae TaxID=118883 RepID=UPI0008460087|nr:MULTISPECIES: acyl-CoA carboxylase subunit beta [unclassified Sulfolobus]TRM74508.1 acyl-CoA carboxylase subunit beta [Sulfolobus sp. A20-N-F8]TRM78233.1 acyl-CoA carboxylase subunit beta [Sulfolobus sp. B5]TRM86681.1 acyl-CoA carboxylase subunit beta [Sulfolobus sp. E3]TRM89077.1 acyl-CoA carboxylase subunit beta [Sulfolobus sp. C3]TRM94513.1 acyl-CoA carboxylase subunit beta [Sulfolobus sp. A20-N-G8]TRM98310.1 acyl-CoA carboxylase subunit beta [Sulfolobus sp. E1]TRN04167.1 acyl-CoA carb
MSLYEKPSVDKLIEELKQLKEVVRKGGGEERIKFQHSKGKLLARERLNLLFDEGTFNEILTFATTRSTEFGLDKNRYYGDGVIAGWGKIDGRTAFAYAQDFTVLGGSLGETHANKIIRAYEMALKVGAPVIGINDSGGARIQEGALSLEGYGGVFKMNVMASGVIPQITIMAGPSAGGAVYSPALTDFIIMIKGDAYYMFVTGPEITKVSIGEEVSYQDLGGAIVHATKSGVVHFVAENEQDAINITKRLLSYLPSNNMEEPPFMDTGDPADREMKGAESIVPSDPLKPFDMRDVIYNLVDNGEFLEVHKLWAQNITVGFGRIAGNVVGIVANNSMYYGGAIDVDAADKASRFIRFCDAFNIPLISLVDTPGYVPGTDQEYKGIIRHGAKMLYAFAEATVPKITVIVRRSYGGAHIAMSIKSLGADLVYAWPTAEIAVTGPEGAVRILYRKDLQTANNPQELLNQKISEYRKLFANPYWAAERGLIDDVIEPKDTRKIIAMALEMLRNKREFRYPKKHGNIPL